MSTDQATLCEFDSETPKTGYEVCSRPRCGVTTDEGHPCKIPVVPSLEVCHKHLERAFNDEETSEIDNRPVWERQKNDLLGTND